MRDARTNLERLSMFAKCNLVKGFIQNVKQRKPKQDVNIALFENVVILAVLTIASTHSDFVVAIDNKSDITSQKC